ncbi:GTP-binding protein 10-like [Centruroides sculpturatus]|uniref:GTP-binding protein 10-like n=1 Tax=Centruroides sculpturatus TaxID=218467 RepID=UPI000C6EC16B|nr:GTP-binding protein 10-like [Centruroides sculpturatus]
MVRVGLSLFQSFKKRHRNFLDSIYIYARGGSGGNGLPKYGGIGGKGGDVYVKATSELTLRDVTQKQPNKRFVGGSGEHSKKYRILGRPGEDLIIDVPTGITVINQKKRVLGDLNNPDDTLLIAKGGCGGSKENQYFGQKGQSVCVTLDLKLIADVGFVGFPNAGKSTLLKALSRASPKIANYPFTTIKPNVGMMVYEDNRQILLADLPGLIEGAHDNFGMGHHFLKHVIRTKLLLFVVDVSGFRLTSNKYDYPYRNALETVMLLNKELELYKEELTDKPAILVVNKMDTENSEKEFAFLLEKLKHFEGKI